MNQYYNEEPKSNVARTEPRNDMKEEFDSYNIIPAVHRAVFVNNEGATLVRHCHYDSAVKSFTAVLKILKPLAALVDASGQSEVVDMPNDDCLPTSVTFANDSISQNAQMDSRPSDESEAKSENNITLTPTGSRNRQSRRLSAAGAAKLLAASGPPNKFARRKTTHFVFRDAVEIPLESVPSSLPLDPHGGYSSELFSKFLMIVMYNLALTLHLQALSLTDNSDNDVDAKKAKKLFLRSRKLYELAFEMHLDESCDVNLLFTLALINNLGLVHDILDQKERSETCFKNMFSTMMYLMDSNESHTVKEWDGLLSNVMDILFQQHREIAAPAAWETPIIFETT